MGWKNWPYWLRGGFIGFLIGLILVLIMFGITPEFNNYIIYPMYILCQGGLECTFSLFGFVLSVIINLILFFIIGSLIGLVFGKIRSRKTITLNCQ